MTQIDKVRKHLTDGKEITPMVAMTVYGISRLASVIEDLRNTGMQIDTILRRDEEGKQYGVYRLRQPIVQGAKVQVKAGYGIGLPRWVRKLRESVVLEKNHDASLVCFVRGLNTETAWLNDKELVRVQ